MPGDQYLCLGARCPRVEEHKEALRALCAHSHGVVTFSRRPKPTHPMHGTCVPRQLHVVRCALSVARCHPPSIENNQEPMKQAPTQITRTQSPNNDAEGHDSSPWQHRPCPQQALMHCTLNPARQQPCTHERVFLLCGVLFVLEVVPAVVALLEQ